MSDNYDNRIYLFDVYGGTPPFEVERVFAEVGDHALGNPCVRTL